MKAQDLNEQFEDSNSMKLFEIYSDGEYYVFYLDSDEKGLYAGGCSNVGFMPYYGLFVTWDDSFCLDEHLEALYELCLESI